MLVLLVIVLCFFIYLLIFMVYKAYHDIIDVRKINVGLATTYPLKLFFISDIHTRTINKQTIASIKEKIDVIIIGGDLLEKGVSFKKVRNNILTLQLLEAPIYFIWGNNDYEVDITRLQALFDEYQVTTLRNKSINFEYDNNTISFIGLDCCTEGEPDFDGACSQATGDCMVLLTHDPSAFYLLNDDKVKLIDLVLSGHTHGGQIRLFGFGPYTRGGLTLHNNIPIFVSEGYGYTKLPFRLGTKAECHIISVE